MKRFWGFWEGLFLGTLKAVALYHNERYILIVFNPYYPAYENSRIARGI